MIDILLTAFLLSVVLLGIHSFYGLEIIKRGIIFTDLAIGQMSALGAAVSIYFFNEQYLYPISLIFALLAGFVISLASRRTNRLEAFIGILYALGISAVFLLLSKSSHGMEKFQKLMAADILFTPMIEVIKVAGIYAVIGVILFILYKKTSGFLKDLLFFITFAATVTSSVKLAGVLIVFALLVGPALIAICINRWEKFKLAIAWIIGTIINLAAIWVSYSLDLPTGYTIVFSHALIVIIIVLLTPKRKCEDDEVCTP